MAIQILFHTSVELKTHTKDHLSVKLSHGKVNKLPQHTQSWQKGRKPSVYIQFCFSFAMDPELGNQQAPSLG